MLDEDVAEKHTLLVYGGGARSDVTGGCGALWEMALAWTGRSRKLQGMSRLSMVSRAPVSPSQFPLADSIASIAFEAQQECVRCCFLYLVIGG